VTEKNYRKKKGKMNKTGGGNAEVVPKQGRKGEENGSIDLNEKRKLHKPNQ